MYLLCQYFLRQSCMNIKKLTLSTSDVPEILRNIPQPPKQLFWLGGDVNELLSRPCVAIVGSRKVSIYGKTATINLAGALAKQGVVIVSGLALGVDGIAHQAALDAGGTTIAVLPCGLDRIYPSTHRQLAKDILRQGGALTTEYPEGTDVRKFNFVARNRLISGLADVVVLTEAAQKSGSLQTADFALDQGREVMAVPGNITSTTSAGTNNLIKTGAGVITEPADVLRALGLEPEHLRVTPKSANPNEQAILNLLADGLTDGAEILARSDLAVTVFNQSLTMLEIQGHVHALGNNQWRL